MTWNVQRASATRARRQVTWMTGEVGPDVLVLSEVPASGRAHADELAASGYAVICPDPDTYRVIVAVRHGSLSVRPGPTAGQPGRMVLARLSIAGHVDLDIAGVYVPSRGPRHERNVAKRAFQSDVTRVLTSIAPEASSATPLVVAGDLNVVEPGHLPHHRVFGAWEYDFYREFAANGLVDAYRHLHPAGHDHSWFGRSGAGYRLDHVFHSAPEALREAAYHQEPRTAQLSDHAAMVVRMDLPRRTHQPT